MTTIIYDGNKIVCDTRSVLEDIIVNDDIEKHVQIEDHHFWLLGTFSEAQKMTKAYMTGNNDELCFDEEEDNTKIIILLPNKKIKIVSYYKSENEKVVMWEDYCSANKWAWGSGKELAIGAMDSGLDGEKAMKVVMGRDLYTGGNIKTFDVLTGRMNKLEISNVFT